MNGRQGYINLAELEREAEEVVQTLEKIADIETGPRPMSVAYSELGTPLATARFTAHEKGGFYGLETTPRRILSEALSPSTPVPGLFLSGQDVMTPGIAGSLWAGLLTAAAIDPRIYRKLG